jgi:hypothetical protein
MGEPKDLYKSKKTYREDLKLKNIKISSLETGYIYVFNLDKETIFTKQVSSPAVFKFINPELSDNLDTITLKRKSDNLATYINKELKYVS